MGICEKSLERARVTGGVSAELLYDLACDKILKYSSKEENRIIDVGCGKGLFLDKLKNTFPESIRVGIDIHNYLPDDTEHELIVMDLNGPEIDNVPKADFVVSLEVIEHLQNPRDFINNLAKIVKPEGLFLITTPNVESYVSLLCMCLKGYFRGFGPKSYPQHITPLTEYQLGCIIDETDGVEIIDIDYSHTSRIPFTWKTWQTYFSFLKGKRWSDNILVLAKKLNS